MSTPFLLRILKCVDCDVTVACFVCKTGNAMGVLILALALAFFFVRQ